MARTAPLALGGTTAVVRPDYPWIVGRERNRRLSSEVEPSQLDDVDDLGLTRLRDSLERFVDHLGAPPISILTQLHDRWPELVGPGLAAATRPVELRDGVLTVACADAAWASQIGWMETQIIRRFETTFGSETVQRVRTRVDSGKAR